MKYRTQPQWISKRHLAQGTATKVVQIWYKISKSVAILRQHLAPSFHSLNFITLRLIKRSLESSCETTFARAQTWLKSLLQALYLTLSTLITTDHKRLIIRVFAFELGINPYVPSKSPFPKVDVLLHCGGLTLGSGIKNYKKTTPRAQIDFLEISF